MTDSPIIQNPNNLTFEQLPKVVAILIDEVRELKKALSEKSEPDILPDKWMNIQELQEYLPNHPAKNTIYSWVSGHRIPNHKGAKNLRFLKSDIDQWLLSGKRKSESELHTEAANYRSGKKGLRRYE